MYLFFKIIYKLFINLHPLLKKKMELQELEKLVKSYLKGKTTLQEKQQLIVYFSSNNIDPSLQKYQQFFFDTSLKQEVQKNKIIRNLILISVIAFLATILIIYQYKNKKTQENLGTFNNPEKALIETHKALEMVSKNINEGMQQAVYLEEYEKTKKTIFK